MCCIDQLKWQLGAVIRVFRVNYRPQPFWDIQKTSVITMKLVSIERQCLYYWGTTQYKSANQYFMRTTGSRWTEVERILVNQIWVEAMAYGLRRSNFPVLNNMHRRFFFAEPRQSGLCIYYREKYLSAGVILAVVLVWVRSWLTNRHRERWIQ